MFTSAYRYIILLFCLFCMPLMMVAQESDTSAESERNQWLPYYYSYSGKSFISVISAGYSYWFSPILDAPHIGEGYSFDKENLEFPRTHHVINLSTLDFRVGIFGMTPLGFEFGVGPLSQWVGYKPSVRLYFPIGKMMAIVPYGGLSADVTYLRTKVDKKYNYIKNNDFYLSAHAGLAINFSGLSHFPMEIKAEYRHPLVNDQIQGPSFVLGAQLYIGKPLGRTHKSILIKE